VALGDVVGAIIQAVATIIIYFFMEETMYFRGSMEGVDSGDDNNGTTTPEVLGTSTPTEKNEKVDPVPETLEGSNAVLTTQ